jgi:hypothetical protein
VTLRTVAAAREVRAGRVEAVCTAGEDAKTAILGGCRTSPDRAVTVRRETTPRSAWLNVVGHYLGNDVTATVNGLNGESATVAATTRTATGQRRGATADNSAKVGDTNGAALYDSSTATPANVLKALQGAGWRMSRVDDFYLNARRRGSYLHFLPAAEPPSDEIPEVTATGEEPPELPPGDVVARGLTLKVSDC